MSISGSAGSSSSETLRHGMSSYAVVVTGMTTFVLPNPADGFTMQNMSESFIRVTLQAVGTTTVDDLGSGPNLVGLMAPNGSLTGDFGGANVITGVTLEQVQFPPGPGATPAGALTSVVGGSAYVVASFIEV